MIKYLEHHQIDKVKWDDCISNSCNGIIYAYSWYLDIASPGWDALVENNYESVFPLTKNKKYGIDYLFNPYFIQQLGLFSKEKILQVDLNNFLSAIPEQFKFIEINLNSENKFVTPGFEQKQNLTHHLDLSASYESISKNYSESLKRNLKKAYALKQTVARNGYAPYIVVLFRTNRGKEITKLKDRHYSQFEKTVEVALQKNFCEVYDVNNEKGNTIAGAIFMESNNKAVFIFSGSNSEARDKFSMALLMDTYIRDHSGKNLILDFEGSNDVNLARFYKSFGAKEIVYLQIKKNTLPFPLKFFKK